MPPLIGELLMRSNIEDQFRGMVREIERRDSAAARAGGERSDEALPARALAGRGCVAAAARLRHARGAVQRPSRNPPAPQVRECAEWFRA